MPALRIGWLGYHQEGVPALTALIDQGMSLTGIITLTPEDRAGRAGAVDLVPIAGRAGLPLIEVSDINSEPGLLALHRLDLDVLLVIGWSQILRTDALGLVRLGCFGAHASLLPANRGSAPVNWAILKGETRTGNTLIRLSPDVCAGDLVHERDPSEGVHAQARV